MALPLSSVRRSRLGPVPLPSSQRRSAWEYHYNGINTLALTLKPEHMDKTSVGSTEITDPSIAYFHRYLQEGRDDERPSVEVTAGICPYPRGD